MSATAGAGRPAGAHDLMIAGEARNEGLVLVTNNFREYERMPGGRAETGRAVERKGGEHRPDGSRPISLR